MFLILRESSWELLFFTAVFFIHNKFYLWCGNRILCLLWNCSALNVLLFNFYFDEFFCFDINLWLTQHEIVLRFGSLMQICHWSFLWDYLLLGWLDWYCSFFLLMILFESFMKFFLRLLLAFKCFFLVFDNETFDVILLGGINLAHDTVINISSWVFIG